jgi:uncharacterized membrane protein
MTYGHIAVLIIVTFIMLTIEIYFIGYARVRDKKSRPFSEFWGKRIFTFWLVALFVSGGISLLFAYDAILTTTEFVKFVLVLSFPASVGAAIADLLKRY